MPSKFAKKLRAINKDKIDVDQPEKNRLVDTSEVKNKEPRKRPKNPTKKKKSHNGNKTKKKKSHNDNSTKENKQVVKETVGCPTKDFDIDEAIELVGYKLPGTAIAQHFGLHVQTLNRRLQEYGYKGFSDFKQYHSEKKINSIRKTLFDKAIDERHFHSLKLIAESYTEIGEGSRRNGSNSLGFDEKTPKIIFLDDDLSENHIKLDLDERAIALKKKNFLKHQWSFLQDGSTKYLALIAGFGSGKTHILLRKVLIAHLSMTCDNGDSIGKSDGLIVYPTNILGTQLFWIPFLSLLSKIGLKYETNKADHTITTKFGIIRMLSGETPEKIVGFNSSFAGIDELDTMKKSQQVWDAVNARLRGRENAQLFTTSTPEGFGFLYKKFVKEPQTKLEEGGEVLTKIIKAKTYDNPFLPDGWIESLRNQYTEKQLQAYLNGDFVNFKGSNAYSFDRALNVGKVKRRKGERVYCGMDFNVNPMSFILFNAEVEYQELPNGQRMPMLKYFDVFKSVSLPNSNTRKSCQWIKKNYPDEDITFIVDRSGNARKTSADKTDVDIIREFGYKVNYLSNLSEKDKLNYCNFELEKGIIKIDEKEGSYLIDDLEAVTLTENGTINKKDKTKTHQSDSLAYSVAWLVRRKKESRSIDGYLNLM